MNVDLEKPINPTYEEPFDPSNPSVENSHPYDVMFNFDEIVDEAVDERVEPTTVAIPSNTTIKMRVAAIRSSKRTRQALEEEGRNIRDDNASDRPRRKTRKTVQSAKPPQPSSSVILPRRRITEEDATRIRWGQRSRKCGVQGCNEMLYIDDMQSARVHFYSHFHALTPAQVSRLSNRRKKREAEGDEENREGGDGADDGNEGERGAQESSKPQVQCRWNGCSTRITDGTMQIHRHLDSHMNVKYRCPKGCGKKDFTRACTAYAHGDKCKQVRLYKCTSVIFDSNLDECL